MKTNYSELEKSAWDMCREVTKAVEDATKDVPLVIFTEDQAQELADNDGLYELPFGYLVDKHFFYVEGRIMEVCGRNIKLFLTGEGDYGTVYDTDMDEIEVPVQCQISLLSHLSNR